jgi:hypothetical protein
MPLRSYRVRRARREGHFFDDFPGGLHHSRTWSSQGGGGGSLALSTSGVGGQLVITAAAGTYHRTYQVTEIFSAARGFEITWRGRLNSLTEARGSWGTRLLDADHIEWIYDVSVGANWLAKTTAVSVSTTVDTGVAADTNWHEFKITVETGRAIFTLDNVPITTITTNVPTANQGCTAQAESTGLGTSITYCDWCDVYGGRL